MLEDSYSSEEEEKVNTGFSIDTSKIKATPYEVMKSMQGGFQSKDGDDNDGQIITDFNKLSMQGKYFLRISLTNPYRWFQQHRQKTL